MQNLAAPTIALFNLGGTELVLILFIFLLLFGAKRLPELARGFGKSIREFKKATSEVEDDIRHAMDQPTPNNPPAKNPPPPNQVPPPSGPN